MFHITNAPECGGGKVFEARIEKNSNSRAEGILIALRRTRDPALLQYWREASLKPAAFLLEALVLEERARNSAKIALTRTVRTGRAG